MVLRKILKGLNIKQKKINPQESFYLQDTNWCPYWVKIRIRKGFEWNPPPQIAERLIVCNFVIFVLETVHRTSYLPSPLLIINM